MRMTQISLIVLLLAPAAATAQEARPASPAQEQPAVDVNRLPIDVGRIQSELRQSAERNENEGLRLRYFIDVYGQAPPIVIFGPEDNLVDGPVPYGAPTHREMINQNTPHGLSSDPPGISTPSTDGSRNARRGNRRLDPRPS